MFTKEETFLRKIALIIVLGIVVIVIVAAVTRLWVLTAIVIGFLFGFFLEKADLCGSSAFSEVLLMKDARKLLGIGVVIVISMLGFALLSSLGLVKLNPKPLQWAANLVGGLIFGVGIVLAGGCVSGNLFKTGQGNLNSMAALIGIPLGVAIVDFGPLKGFNQMLNSFVIKSADGGPVTFPSLLHIPYWAIALVIGGASAIVAVVLRRKAKKVSRVVKPTDASFLELILIRSWKPWHAGIAIGILGCFAYLSSAASGRNYPLGVTHGVLETQLLLTDYPLEHVYAPKLPAPTEAKLAVKPNPKKKIVWWLVLEVVTMIPGAYVSAKLSRKFRFAPKPPDETVIAFFGGIILGMGAGIAGGCIIGNIMSGWALMSVGNIIFGLATLIANWATTYIYMMGGQWN